jgi:cytochrome c553
MKAFAVTAIAGAALLTSAMALSQANTKPAPAVAKPAAPAAAPAPVAKPALKPNLKAGAVLAYTCTGCHGIDDYKNAYPTYKVPKIGGQSEAYLIAALKAYRKGDRQHPTMNGQAGSLSDQDIVNVAAYISTYKAAK